VSRVSFDMIALTDLFFYSGFPSVYVHMVCIHFFFSKFPQSCNITIVCVKHVTEQLLCGPEKART
jgi:hypothetical protein